MGIQCRYSGDELKMQRRGREGCSEDAVEIQQDCSGKELRMQWKELELSWDTVGMN